MSSADNENMHAAKGLRAGKFQLVVMTALFLSSCGLKGTASSCATGTAQITVTDSTISRDCGCAEGTATFSAGQATFQCTITHGTSLYIEFNTTAYHRMTFGTSPEQEVNYTPGSSDANPQAISFPNTTSGTGAGFADSQTQITGFFIVQ